METIKENELIFETYRQSIIRENAQIEELLRSGVDVFLNLDIRPAVIVYNAGSTGNTPQDSILTTSAFEALERTIKDPNISGEGDTEHDQLIGSFWDPSTWIRLTSQNLQQVPQDVIVIDHNGN